MSREQVEAQAGPSSSLTTLDSIPLNKPCKGYPGSFVPRELPAGWVCFSQRKSTSAVLVSKDL